MEGYITTTEAAERLGISSARVRQLVLSGKLPAIRFGPVNMVKETDLSLVTSRPAAGRPPKAKTNDPSESADATHRLNKAFREAAEADQEASKVTMAEKAVLKSAAPKQTGAKKTAKKGR
ncbi:MAG: helix-turn-helix domain-containing protein [Pyrinomonadaceae bacterium]